MSRKNNNMHIIPFDALFYIHGLQTKAPSSKVRFLKNCFPSIPVVAPSHTGRAPSTANQLESALKETQIKYGSKVLLIGASLGGFWANWLAEKYLLPCILINPSVKPTHTLKRCIGEQVQGTKWLESDVVDYSAFESKSPKPINRQLLLAKDDQVIDYRIALEFFDQKAQIHVFDSGGHRFTQVEEISKAVYRLE